MVIQWCGYDLRRYDDANLWRAYYHDCDYCLSYAETIDKLCTILVDNAENDLNDAQEHFVKLANAAFPEEPE